MSLVYCIYYYINDSILKQIPWLQNPSELNSEIAILIKIIII